MLHLRDTKHTGKVDVAKIYNSKQKQNCPHRLTCDRNSQHDVAVATRGKQLARACHVHRTDHVTSAHGIVFEKSGRINSIIMDVRKTETHGNRTIAEDRFDENAD